MADTKKKSSVQYTPQDAKRRIEAEKKKKSSVQYTPQDAKRRIEAEKKKNPEAFQKKYGHKMPRVQSK